MTSKEKKDELYKLAQEDGAIMSLMRLFDSDNAPWWDFAQLVECEIALNALDRVIPAQFDEDRVDLAFDTLDDCAYRLADHVNAAYREVFGCNCNRIRNVARRIAESIK